MRQTLNEVDLSSTGGIQAFETRDNLSVLHSFLARLRPSDREVLDLYYFRALSLVEIGKRLDLSAAAAHMRLTRARLRLKSEFNGMQQTRRAWMAS